MVFFCEIFNCGGEVESLTRNVATLSDRDVDSDRTRPAVPEADRFFFVKLTDTGIYYINTNLHHHILWIVSLMYNSDKNTQFPVHNMNWFIKVLSTKILYQIHKEKTNWS